MKFRLLSAAAATSAALLISGCSVVSGEGGGPFKEKAPEPQVEVVSSAAGQKLTLQVKDGSLQNVQLVDDSAPSALPDLGTIIPEKTSAPTASASGASTPSASSAQTSSTGQPSADASEAPSASPSKGLRWESDYLLAGSATYTWKATALDGDNKEHQLTGTFSTKGLKQDNPVRARLAMENNQKVGVGAPIIVNFTGPIPEKYRATVESRMSVDVTDKAGAPREVEGSWAWLPDGEGGARIHYRPKEFWPEFSKVTVKLPLKDVPMGKTQKGQKDTTLKFNVDRNQVVEGNVKTHRMVVKRNGKKVWNFPASFGRPGPRTATHNGMHVVMSKDYSYIMRSQQWNYETQTYYAVRIHNNGEFIHAAPWSVGSQGSANVSHGCVNISMSNAKRYFNTALFGDPVNITGSTNKLSKSSGDIVDWIYTWPEWTARSAIPPKKRAAAEKVAQSNAEATATSTPGAPSSEASESSSPNS